MVQRTLAGGISQMGRATQGVKVMNMREDDRVSAVALVVESDAGSGAAGDGAGPEPAPGAAADEADTAPPKAHSRRRGRKPKK
jgi:DNA gyrase subunit A